MYCPRCSRSNPADADKCQCGQETRYFRERVFIGRQFIFVQADDAHPVALKVDGAVQTFRTSAILSRHQHAVSLGDEAPRSKKQQVAPLPDQPRLAPPSLQLLTVVTDRKIYKPGGEACVFIAAPDAANSIATLEIKLAGQKVFEAQVMLSADGLALYRYPDLREGEYAAQVTLPGASGVQADCDFSVAEFTLSPLIAALLKHEYSEQHLRFTLKLLLLSAPYSGEVEFGLQCQVCGERVVATQTAQAKEGLAYGDFDLSSHGGPFHVQVTTPDGNTALVSFPGTGATERAHLQINPLGQAAEAGLLPWQDAQPVRGFYVGTGEMNMTPLMLQSVHAAKGRLQVARNLPHAQVVTFNPRQGSVILSEAKNLNGDVGKMARLALSRAKRPALSAAGRCGATSWRQRPQLPNDGGNGQHVVYVRINVVGARGQAASPARRGSGGGLSPCSGRWPPAGSRRRWRCLAPGTCCVSSPSPPPGAPAGGS
jgi:hypothetical protein